MKQFTLRGFFIGLIGLGVITSSSMYIALRVGALPWPTVFVTVLSMAVYGKIKDHTLQEVNVTHTLMSSGAMIAGGLAFTLPGIWILNPNANIPVKYALIATILGAVLGSLFSAFFRSSLIERKDLVFPIGRAAYDTLVTGINKGKQSLKLFVSMGFSVVFTFLRDLFGIIPSVVYVYKGSSKVPSVNCWISPMAFAIGAVINKVAAFFWILGAVCSYLVLSPIGVSDIFKQNLGIGIMIGTGIGILIKTLLQFFTDKNKTVRLKKRDVFVGVGVIFICAVILSSFTELVFLQTVIVVCLVAVTCLLSGILTGQSGINPMEVFGILVMLAAGFIKSSSTLSLFTIAALTAVACGLSGDVMNDLKSGSMLKTNLSEQIFAELVGGIIGAVFSVVSLYAIKRTFGTFGTDLLPAPQARAVASVASGFGNSLEFVIGIACGTVLFFLKIPSATLGLGIYLPAQISVPVGLGCLCSWFAKMNKNVTDNDVNLVSSGLLGGEGIAGVLIAIISMF